MTATVQFRRVDLARDREAVFAISLEYMRWVVEGLAADPRTAAVVPPLTVSLEEYTAGAIDAVGGHEPPEGDFYLVECDGQVAGMCGWRRIAEGVGELKRIYVKPTHRGRKLGEAILLRLLEDARAAGCHRIVLDTAPFMHAAQRLYEAAGFRDCAPYAGTEVPAEWHAVWRFMARGSS